VHGEMAVVERNGEPERRGMVNGKLHKMRSPSRAEAPARIPIDLTANGHINSARCVRRGKIEDNREERIRGDPARTAKR